MLFDSALLFFWWANIIFSVPCSAAAQNAEAGQAGTGQKSGKEPAPGRRKEDAKQAVKKPKEKENALSQFDLNNYASKCLRLLSILQPVVTFLHSN